MAGALAPHHAQQAEHDEVESEAGDARCGRGREGGLRLGHHGDHDAQTGRDGRHRIAAPARAREPADPDDRDEHEVDDGDAVPDRQLEGGQGGDEAEPDGQLQEVGQAAHALVEAVAGSDACPVYRQEQAGAQPDPV